YHIDLINSSVMPRSTMMLAAGKFVITPMQGRLRCAGIVEFGGLKAPPNKAPHRLLKKHIHNLFPDLTYDRMDLWMGHRPALPDSIPMIGPIDEVSGVYTAFGHHHVGLAGSARTGRLIADMIAQRDTQIDVSPYRPCRFTH
ncbi:MAG: FAD-binding oxidoreductase, partial [Methylococcales bacterium]|nr:FAD-binding oxidoreductase [Methylococcales bacterium]